MGRHSRLAIIAALVGLACVMAPVAAAAAGRSAKVVRYLGATVRVPREWPVYDLARNPRTCVRFDRHAVYLGRPSAAPACSARAAGRTEALWLQPAQSASEGLGLPSGPNVSELRLGDGRVTAVATWARQPALIARALGTSPALHPPAPLRPSVAAAAAVPRRGGNAPVNHLGFDPCATPSRGAMQAWRFSPYRTVGVYLGGADMACAQPNLTPGWVSAETAAGWRFIPTYVGLQAPGNSCGCAAMSASASRASGEGRAAASDALARARAVGLGPGNPIYFDMEAYPRGRATGAVLAFLGAWTNQLHRAGYVSGVYSSAGSGIRDLVAAQHTSFREPDDIWIADWNGARTTIDPYVPASDWGGHQRLHQFFGDRNVSYGGVEMNIDGDYINGATAVGGTQIPDGTFVQVRGSAAVYRIAGGAPLLVTGWTQFGGPQPVRMISAARFNALNAVPAGGTFLATPQGNAYRVAGGYAFPITNRALFGSGQQAVTVDPWDLANAGTPASHLRSAPASGTVVTGLPSRGVWLFQAGSRIALPAPAAGLSVEDAALVRFRVDPYAVAPCVVPRLHGLTLPKVRLALAANHCRLGRVRRPRERHPPKQRRVAAQTPVAAVLKPLGWRVAITLR